MRNLIIPAALDAGLAIGGTAFAGASPQTAQTAKVLMANTPCKARSPRGRMALAEDLSGIREGLLKACLAKG